MNQEHRVTDDMVVHLDYTLRLDDGEVVDTSEGSGPLAFLQGHGQIVPGLEKELYGMAVGDKKQVTVTPGEGYGERGADARQEFDRSTFPEELELELGMAIQLSDERGRSYLAFVEEIEADQVILDFNHPLAGETLHFEVEIAGLRPASGEELAHGHAH